MTKREGARFGKALSLVLMLILLMSASLAFMPFASAADAATFDDQFASWTEADWVSSYGLTDPEIVSGEVELKNATNNKEESSTWIGHYGPAGSQLGAGYVNLTFRAKPSAVLSTDLYIGLKSFGLYEPSKNSILDFMWLSSGQLRVEWYNDGVGWHQDVGPYDVGNWHEYSIIWEQNRTRWFIDGVLNYTKQNDAGLPDEPMRVVMSTTASAGSFRVDWLTVREDRELSYTYPSLTGYQAWLNDTGLWVPGNLTLIVRTKEDFDQGLYAYIPLGYKNYYCSVKKSGTPHTNVKFVRGKRELQLIALGSGYKKIDIQLVDPPEWLVDFAYWFMAATGISLAPLLKIWDRLAKKDKMLPYIVILLGLVFLVFVVWLIWQWISFQATHPRL